MIAERLGRETGRVMAESLVPNFWSASHSLPLCLWPQAHDVSAAATSEIIGEVLLAKFGHNKSPFLRQVLARGRLIASGRHGSGVLRG